MSDECQHIGNVEQFDVDSIGGHWRLLWCADCGAVNRETIESSGSRHARAPKYEGWEQPRRLRIAIESGAASNAVILGLDPVKCDRVYPRTRDGRCQGCGIVGDHPESTLYCKRDP